MYKFVQLDSPRLAQLFASYCQTLGLEVSAVIIHHDRAELYANVEQLNQISAEFERFAIEPEHERYQAAAWQQSIPDQQTYQVNRLSEVNWRLLLRQGSLTIGLLLSCLVVFIWQQLDWYSSSRTLQLVAGNDIWRWFTPVLLHFSMIHLVFNLAWWLYLARQIENKLGTILLLCMTLTIAGMSNAAQYFLVGPNFGGLSGVVYGLFGYFWIAGRINPTQGLAISSGLIGFMLLWLVLGFFDVLWVNMANWAHLAGLLGGMLWAWLLRNNPGHRVVSRSITGKDT